jgi:hypothetical protein
MVEFVGDGFDIADGIVGNGGIMVECIGGLDYSIEYVVIEASSMGERIGNAENIPDFIVGSFSYLTFDIFNLNPPIEGIVFIFSAIAIGIDCRRDIA